MRKRSKNIAMLLALSMMVFPILTGCSGGETGKTERSVKDSATEKTADTKTADSKAADKETDTNWDTEKEDKIILTVINNYYTAGQKKAAEEYTKLHPETNVVVDVISDNDSYMTKMKTVFSGDYAAEGAETPDIVHGNFVVNALTATSWNVAFEKNYLMDLSSMLEEENPYNEGKKVKEAFDESDLAVALNKTGGAKLGILPFDKIGVAFFYNKDIFEKEGVAVPETFEALVEACETFKENGYNYPISAGLESSWFLNSIADSGYRTIEDQFLVQPQDAIWDAATMKANEGFQFNSADLNCDKNIVNSDERLAVYKKENSVNTDINKTIWESFAKIAEYFPENWVGADGSQIIDDFEMGNSPMLLQGSFNAGKILADINQLPEDSRFAWSTFQFPSFESAPEGLEKTLRGLYVLGNEIAIVPKASEDHNARVRDFYKFMYSPDQAQMIYEETLANGNFIQGPSVIAGVSLDSELQEKLDGFVPEGTARDWDNLTGFTRVTQANMPKFYELVNNFTSGEVDVDGFLNDLSPLYDEYTEEGITSSGFDLDPATADTAKE